MDIVIYGDPVLRQTAQAISPTENGHGFGQEIDGLANALVRAVTLKSGYGLAAPQLGVSKRLIVLDVESELHIVVNPEIGSRSGDVVLGVEGCLSLPGAEAEVQRRRKVVVRGWTVDGEVFELEAEDLLARVFQHEIDHLNGVLFIDHLGEAKRLQVLKEFERKRKELSTKA